MADEPDFSASQRKRGRPVTIGPGRVIGLRLHPEELAALDRWIALQPEPVTRSVALRALMVRGLYSTQGDVE